VIFGVFVATGVFFKGVGTFFVFELIGVAIALVDSVFVVATGITLVDGLVTFGFETVDFVVARGKFFGSDLLMGGFEVLDFVIATGIVLEGVGVTIGLGSTFCGVFVVKGCFGRFEVDAIF
jgi:hypothetical protein